MTFLGSDTPSLLLAMSKDCFQWILHFRPGSFAHRKFVARCKKEARNFAVLQGLVVESIFGHSLGYALDNRFVLFGAFRFDGFHSCSTFHEVRDLNILGHTTSTLADPQAPAKKHNEQLTDGSHVF